MNQMGHDILNMIGVDARQGRRARRPRRPRLHADGPARDGRHGDDGNACPEEQHPDGRRQGDPFDAITMGGMFTIVKVRDEDIGDENKDPGWYEHPPGTVADLARKEDMARDGIQGVKPRSAALPGQRTARYTARPRGSLLAALPACRAGLPPPPPPRASGSRPCRPERLRSSVPKGAGEAPTRPRRSPTRRPEAAGRARAHGHGHSAGT